jgi:hypothetical protein
MMNRKLKSLGGTSKVITLDSTGQWIECTTQEDIEAGCQQENSQYFSQTTSTPFMTSPLVEDSGYLAQGPSTLAVLEGTYAPPPDTDIYACKLLRQLQMDPHVAAAPPMEVTFSVAQHIQGWRKAR